MKIPESLAHIIQKSVNKFGYKFEPFYNPNLTNFESDVLSSVKPYTFTPIHAILSLIDSVKYIVKNDVNGCFIECGVYKGGSIMTMIKTLNELKINDREIFLFDTFEGMPPPGKFDYRPKTGTTPNLENDETIVSLDEVKNNVLSLGYDESKIHFIKGKVEDTLPKIELGSIALLRLDTDWYESTKIELEYLYPKLSQNGVIIIDDYESYFGAKKATDEYLNDKLYLHRIVPSGARIGIKTN